MRREKGEQKKGDDKRTTKASAIQGAAARNGNQTHVRLGQAVSVGNTAPNKRGTPPPPPPWTSRRPLLPEMDHLPAPYTTKDKAQAPFPPMYYLPSTLAPRAATNSPSSPPATSAFRLAPVPARKNS